MQQPASVVVRTFLAAVGDASAPKPTAEDVITAGRAATARYLDIARAREDGFVQGSGMEPRHGVT